MGIKRLVLGVAGLAILVTGCDTPNDANVKIEQSYDLPVLKAKKFFFYGGSDAFIDTTSGKFDTLFSSNADGSMFISYDEEFEIGDLDDAIPEVDVDPTSIESEVGVIEVDDFTSDFNSQVGPIEKDPVSIENTAAEVGTFEPEFQGSGSADFQQITGNPSPANGGLVPGLTDVEITIELDAGEFQSAVAESGGFAVTFTNDLGFDISQMEAQLVADANTLTPTDIGTPLTFTNIPHDGNNSVSDNITFSQGEVIATTLEMRVTLSWNNQNYSTDQDELSVVAQDDNLVVSEAVAEVGEQALNPNTPGIEINEDGFSNVILTDNFGQNDLNQLTLTLQNITNLPLTDDTFADFPLLTLRNADGDVLDEPRRAAPAFPSGNVIGPGETAEIQFNLVGEKLTQTLNYTLNLGTPGVNNAVSVTNTDEVSISATTSDLEATSANAAISPQDDIDLADTSAVEGDFVRAEVDNGALNLTFSNDLPIPIDITELNIFNKNAFVTKNTGRYIAAGTNIGTLNNISIPANGSTQESIDLAGKAISDEIIFEAIATSEGSNGQPEQISENDLINVNIEGSIEVTEADAVLKSQDFSSTDTLSIDDENFRFTRADHYITLKGGELRISNLANTLDVDVDTLRIDVPSLIAPDGTPLEIGFYGNQQQGTVFPFIKRNESGTRGPVVIDLTGYRIEALNNEVEYDVFGITENTEGKPDSLRSIKSTDKVTAELEILGLEIDEAIGQVVRNEVILGEDEVSNGEDILDISNDVESEIVELDLQEISDNIQNLQLTGTELGINYSTDIGSPATVYMAIAAFDADGEIFYLQGRNDKAVTESDSVDGLQFNGTRIANENLIKFDFGVSSDQPLDIYEGSVVFNNQNSSVDEFLSKLPNEIRTIGIAVVNPDSDENNFVRNPITFETNLNANMPLNITTSEGEPLTVEQDLENVSLGDVPSEDDDLTIETANLTIIYENKLPLGLNVELLFFDADSSEVEVDYSPISISTAEVDANGFSTTPASEVLDIQINSVYDLSEVVDMKIRIQATSSGDQTVKIREDDYVEIQFSASATGSVESN